MNIHPYLQSLIVPNIYITFLIKIQINNFNVYILTLCKLKMWKKKTTERNKKMFIQRTLKQHKKNVCTSNWITLIFIKEKKNSLSKSSGG